ncbi:protein ELYS isoform X2 [Danaus plexippus]|uniref:protein ELYS isoform X2 n=1 Tax=Danaus plexippus TaxID=13037 RepID=UPI002AB28B8B|nr:protein ELYS isoform X2 [Danaus plexippus]
MQKLQESVFSIIKTTNLSSAVFSFLQPTEEYSDKTPLGGILQDTKYGWLALGPKFCVVDLRSGLKIAARTFGNGVSNKITVTSVVELPTPLTDNSQQLIISLEYDDATGLICIFHINGSQLLRCIQTDGVITELTVCDAIPNGPLMCFDGLIMAGTHRGEIFIFDLNKASLIQALKDLSQGYEEQVRGEQNVANLIFLPLKAVHKIESQRDLAVENDDHLALLLNENSFHENQYIFCNPDGTVRMKAKQSHIRTTVVQYIPQLGSLAVGFNFGAFQLWNLLNLELEFTSQVNVECLPVTHFGFQEPCDDPRAFCYLWVVFSVIDRFEEEEFPLAVMYSLTYQGKRMLAENKYLYQEFSMATIRFQIELGAIEDVSVYIGGRCISCHTYSISSVLGEEGEDTMLNLCQLVWECWGENNTVTQHCMLLFDLDQWYKDQMPATYRLENNAFMSTARCPEISRGSCVTLDLRLDSESVTPYSHATRLEEHFFPNSLQYNCVALSTWSTAVVQTAGVQRQLVRGMSAAGPACLLAPARLYAACKTAGLTPLYAPSGDTPEDQRRFLLSVALEARLSSFLKRCAHDWATGTHSGVGCTLPFLVDWSWSRAIELKENAKELTAPLFTSSMMPDRNVIRCLEHCVQQLSQLTGLLDAILTKCCNLVVPDALSEMEEKYKGIGTVSLYFQVVQWFVRVGLLPEKSSDRHSHTLPYPVHQLCGIYNKRRIKLNRLQDKSDDESSNESCSLLYIDQLIEHEFGGDRVHQLWMVCGSSGGLYPPPSLFSLLRLYLLPDVPEEHKHSLLLYLLLDYSMIYDDMRHESVIRRLMQFPTMFGLSNTAIKATQAFWHLDHRDFDFALDQLQCLTGNTLSDWQHHVVLSSLLAQKKTQSALQYLHVRKPAPIHVSDNNDYDKLDDWQTSCNLYLARGLVFEALDVIRMCVENAGSSDDKTQLLNYFYKGCRNSGQLAKVLQVTLLPFEEEVFIRYLKECNESHTSDILVMYYLQQARYLEAEQYNSKLKTRHEQSDRGSARDALVATLCRDLPDVTGDVLRCAMNEAEPRIFKPKPMSVYVQANSPKNTFTYKSSFIQDTIENASETWINKPKTRKGIKRALNIEDTPFICTPKAYKSKSVLQEKSDGTPAKRAKLDLNSSGRTPKMAHRANDSVSCQVARLLHMPDLESPHNYPARTDTPQSILKSRPSSRRGNTPYDNDHDHSDHSDHDHDEHRHLRFTIPTSSEAGSSPSPVALPLYAESETDNNTTHPLESPPKKFAAEDISPRKSYKDNVRARRSLSISANSSLSEDPNTSIESIADIPVTLINPRYTGERYMRDTEEERDRDTRNKIHIETEKRDTSYVPNTPKGRRAIRSDGDNTPLSGSRSNTPDRCDSPIITPKRVTRSTRSRSRTPEISPKSSLTPIEELPRQETDTASYKSKYIPSPRSRTPERIEKVIEPPRLEAISESPTKSSQPPQSPTRRSLRSRSRTPEVEIKVDPPVITSPRSLRSRSKTPEKLMSPKKDHGTRKKSLSRIVLEANAFAKTKQIEKMDEEDKPDATGVIECTPVKPSKHTEPPHPCLMDVEFSPIVNKSILHSSSESFSITEKISKSSEDQIEINQLPAFTINEIYADKSVLHSYQSSIGGTESIHDTRESIKETVEICKPLPAFTSITDDFGKSVLHSFESTIDSSNIERKETPKSKTTDYGVLSTDTSASVGQQNESLMTSDSEIDDREWSRLDNQNARVIQKEKERIVEIEREINEIEEMSDECRETCSDSNDSAESEEEEEGSESENDNEVISIEDSDESSDTYKLEIEEDNVTERNQQEQLVQATVGTARDDVAEPQASGSGIQENNEADSELFQASQEKSDALNPARDISILTDDNSVTETEGADKLHYSDDIKNDDQSVAMETDQPVIASAVVEQITTIEQNIEQEIPSREVDVIDSGPSRREDHKVEESETVKTTEAQTESQEKCVPDIKDKDMPEEIENSVVAQEESDKVEIKTQTEDIERTEDTEQVPKTRKRTKSTTSTRSKEGSEVNEKVEPKTPRRRRQSASKAEVEGTPDNNEHTPRTRAKTPSSEVRKILTRRASKELEKTDEHRPEEVPELTPRRSTRRTKKEDDNASVTSDSSVKSGRSRASEDGKPARKGRKSVMNVKPDLTVIPEVAAEESKASDDIIKEYSSARRLTRNQKAVLDSWLEPELPRRKNDNDSDSSLTRTDYDGSPEPDQDSDLETAVKPQRLARAASETKTTPKAARIGRRVSVDIGVTPDEGSPVSGLSRGRRASFTRACEALHTPRRGSTDVKGSPMSEVESTPRRGRRPSATSVKGDVNTPRSKKAAEKNKETNE